MRLDVQGPPGAVAHNPEEALSALCYAYTMLTGGFSMGRRKYESDADYKARRAEYRRRTKERALQYQREYRKCNPDKVKAWDRANKVKRKAANTAYNRAKWADPDYRAQAAKKAAAKRRAHRAARLVRLGDPSECEICGAGGTLVIDHDHARAAELKAAGDDVTKSDRGVLCVPCNVGVGALERGGHGRATPGWIEVARFYLAMERDV